MGSHYGVVASLNDHCPLAIVFVLDLGLESHEFLLSLYLELFFAFIQLFLNMRENTFDLFTDAT